MAADAKVYAVAILDPEVLPVNRQARRIKRLGVLAHPGDVGLKADVSDFAERAEDKACRPVALVAKVEALDSEVADVVEVDEAVVDEALADLRGGGDVAGDAVVGTRRRGTFAPAVVVAAVKNGVAEADDCDFAVLGGCGVAVRRPGMRVGEHVAEDAVRHHETAVIEDDCHSRRKANGLVDCPDRGLCTLVPDGNRYLEGAVHDCGVDGGLNGSRVGCGIGKVVGG